MRVPTQRQRCTGTDVNRLPELRLKALNYALPIHRIARPNIRTLPDALKPAIFIIILLKIVLYPCLLKIRRKQRDAFLMEVGQEFYFLLYNISHIVILRQKIKNKRRQPHVSELNSVILPLAACFQEQRWAYLRVIFNIGVLHRLPSTSPNACYNESAAV